jgi:hypothetical protein
MKKGILLSVFLFFSILSCNEKDEPAVDVKYEVLTETGDWFGEFIDESGEKVCFCEIPLPANGWIYTFQVKDRPFTLHLDATTDSSLSGQAGAPDVTANIYVNDKLVVTNTSNWAPGVASADYVIK